VMLYLNHILLYCDAYLNHVLLYAVGNKGRVKICIYTYTYGPILNTIHMYILLQHVYAYMHVRTHKHTHTHTHTSPHKFLGYAAFV
jgi:hypothetical protein